MNSRLRRCVFTFGFLTALVAPMLAHAQDVLNGIAAKVNDHVITFSEVRRLVAAKEKAAHETLQGAQLEEKIKEIWTQAVNDLIDEELILEEFNKLKAKGASIPEHLVDDRVDGIIREDFRGDRAAFIHTLSAQGFTLDKFREEQMNNLIVQLMRQQMVKGTPVIPEAKIEEYYHQNIEQFSSEDQMKLRMLVIKKNEGDDGRRKTIAEIRQKIASGASFEDLARLYSEDSSTQESGGDWGWINRRTLTESLTKTAFALKPGEVSPVIEMAGNYYLLFCEAKKPGITKPLSQVRDEILKLLMLQDRQQAQEKWLAKLRKAAYIKIFWVK